MRIVISDIIKRKKKRKIYDKTTVSTKFYFFSKKNKNQNGDKEFQDVFRRLFQKAKSYEDI